MKLDEIAETAGISEHQRQKLALAGRGDISRFMDDVDAVEDQYRHAAENDPIHKLHAFPDVEPLQVALAGALFESDSLFEKARAKTLTTEQSRRYKKFALRRGTEQYRVRLEVAVERLSPRLGLSTDGQNRLVQLLLAQRRPPRGLEGTSVDDVCDIVWVEMKSLPEDRLKPLFDAAHWHWLQIILQRTPQTAWSLRKREIILDGTRH